MQFVLILVLVEDGLGVWQRRKKVAAPLVLILVLVEDGLGDPQRIFHVFHSRACLNPCFSGGWSRRATFGSVCQRDCCNDIFNFVNVWRPKNMYLFGCYHCLALKKVDS